MAKSKPGQKRYPPELKERATKMVLSARQNDDGADTLADDLA